MLGHPTPDQRVYAGHGTSSAWTTAGCGRCTEAFTVLPVLAATPAATPGPVLLVDDPADTGWTLTVAARLLRKAGATAVFPLLLAAQG
ncbi:hypothetical protein G3I60_13145 [Streptomyces sp. SID13666]|uniref:hypothetical protein n=1 Tax=unclassified Streptomyces TaxID=2593676 RepID=UPI0013BF81EF|nr:MULTISPECIES: hypothetical protein [unclassified Streptomyces]NEA55063.1 hypothetical protein [Streptomyces sp. SID13666]NEA71070.1 hypothetical protein [Streptomyces sp. SID13588]